MFFSLGGHGSGPRAGIKASYGPAIVRIYLWCSGGTLGRSEPARITLWPMPRTPQESNGLEVQER